MKPEQEKDYIDNCESCNGLYDDSDGPEYGPPWPRCHYHPEKETDKKFPFKEPQVCFKKAWWLYVDWDEESKKLENQSTAPTAEGGEEK